MMRIKQVVADSSQRDIAALSIKVEVLIKKKQEKEIPPIFETDLFYCNRISFLFSFSKKPFTILGKC